MFRLICVASQLCLISCFNVGPLRRTMTTSYVRSTVRMSTEDEERPRVQIKRIVESLSSGSKTGSEVEAELLAIQNDAKLLDASTTLAGSLIGLVTGGLLDGALANGAAPWGAPLGFAVLGGAAYYGVTQKKNSGVAEFLGSALGQPILSAGKSAVSSVQNYIEESKASAVKKVEDTVEEINRVPASIVKSIVDYKDDTVKSIVDYKDDTVKSIKAVPVNIQNAATKSYEDAKQSAIDRVDQKVSELKAIPVDFQAKTTLAAKNAQLRATQKAETIANDIKATPGRLIDAAVLKAEATAADIAKIPEIAANKVTVAYETKKQEITNTIDKNVQLVKSAVNSILPADSKEAA